MRIKKQLFFLVMVAPLVINGKKNTVETGIFFEKDLRWTQVLIKAKIERKYIFVDCFTTWCGPCRQMDKEVYPSLKVGELLNPRFVSIKVQMDTSKKDNDNAKKRYVEARELQTRYRV